MIEFNLEEIKKKTSLGLTKYYSLHNLYRWEEYKDITKEQIYKNTPIFDISSLNLSQSFKKLYSDDIVPWGCFGRFTFNYRFRVNSKVRHLLFEITPLKVMDSRKNNHCWMDIHQLNYWIDTVRQESGLNFFYKIEETAEKYKITFDFIGLNKLQIKYILFWTRYAYEYPASFLALDAILLKQTDYPEETLQNLLTLVSDCQILNNVPLTGGQNITNWGKFIQPEKLRKELNNPRRFSVSAIFGTIDGNYYNNRIYGYPLKDFYHTAIITGSSWIDNTERFKIYHDVYPLLKEHELKLKEEEK